MRLNVAYEIGKVEIKGKNTEVTITNSETGEIFKGVSHCATADVFNYGIGVKVALNRAISAMINTTLEDSNTRLGNYEPYDNEMICNENNRDMVYYDPRVKALSTDESWDTLFEQNDDYDNEDSDNDEDNEDDDED